MTLKYQQIGKYQIKNILGGGGFGTVYLALDAALDMQVAIKVFDPRELANNQTQLSGSGTAATSAEVLQQRFIQEARLLAKLTSHPHIVNILELGQLDDGTPYYVMPYIPHSLVDEIGKDALTAAAQAELPAELQPRRLPAAKALHWLCEILDAMAYVHQSGLVHRDIKPANILLDNRGRVQVCDFGIAKLPDGEYSQSGVGMGTRNYMSPEQRESAKHVDSRSDVYSIAVLAYRMLTGTLPVGRYDDPIAHAPAIGQAVNQLILDAMAVQPANRPQDGSDFLARLKKAMAQATDQPEDDDATGTFIGQSSAELKAELKPLKAKITELLKQEGLLSDKSHNQLKVLADIADISEAELNALIQQTEQEFSAEISPFKKWRQGVEKQLAANNGQLSAELRNTLLEAGLALGKTEAQLLPFLGNKAGPAKAAQPTSNSGVPTERKALSLKPVAAVVIVALLGFGGWQYQSFSAEQTKLKQQDEQAWQQAKTNHTEQSYRQYLTSQAKGNYRLSAEKQLTALKAEAEQQQRLAEQQAKQAASSRQGQIRTAQQWLIKHGFTLTQTGELDARTKAAIEAFEKAEKLLVTSEVDATLLSKLEEAYWRNDKADFAAAKKSNTEQSYISYLSARQDGKYRKEAEQGIAQAKAAIAKAKQEAEKKAEQDAIAKAAAEERARQQEEKEKTAREEEKSRLEALAKAEAENRSKQDAIERQQKAKPEYTIEAENAAYDKAVNMILRDRDYDSAIIEFQSFLENYPNFQYAANAHYWLGQLLLNNNELLKAQQQFRIIVTNFSGSNKVPDALFKLGQLAERQGDTGTAKKYYQNVVSNHRNTTAFRLANERLKLLK